MILSMIKSEKWFHLQCRLIYCDSKAELNNNVRWEGPSNKIAFQ